MFKFFTNIFPWRACCQHEQKNKLDCCVGHFGMFGILDEICFVVFQHFIAQPYHIILNQLQMAVQSTI